MKYLLTLVFLTSFFCSFAQEPTYTPMRGNYKFKGIKIDTLLLIPSFSDTNAANSTYLDQVAGSMIRCGNDFWMRNASTTAWLQNVNVGPGASPIMDFVNNVFKKNGTDSVFYVVSPADTFFSFLDTGVDTTSLSNRIDDKIEDITRISDSISYKKNGIWYFAYKDSLGQPLNFANSNLRATGNRTHSFADYSLYIDSIANLTLKSNAIGNFGLIVNSGGQPFMSSVDQVDYSQSNAILTKDSAFYGGTKGGSYFGLRTNSDNNTIALQRGPNYAYLSKKNFGIDTIALKSDLAGISGGGVDSIYRISGKDSIYWKKGANTYQIKDSTGNMSNISLQNVIDYNRDLVNGNLYMGTNAFDGGSGSYNISIGDNSGNGADTTKNNNILIGRDAGTNNSGDNVIVIGNEAGYNNSGSSDVVGVGYHAANSNSGQNVVSIGSDAGASNSGNAGVFIGPQAGSANSSTEVIAIGESAALSNSGYNSIGIGQSALYYNEGYHVTGIGFEACRDNSGNTIIAIGKEAGYSNIGSGNIFIGGETGFSNEGEDVIQIGRGESIVNTYDSVILFGIGATALDNGQMSLGKNRNGYQIRIDQNGNSNNDVIYTATNANGHFVIDSSAKIDLDAVGADVYLNSPGVYTVSSNTGLYDLFIPDPALFPGQQLILSNESAYDTPINTGTYLIYIAATTSTFTDLEKDKMILAWSDGTKWHGIVQ